MTANVQSSVEPCIKSERNVRTKHVVSVACVYAYRIDCIMFKIDLREFTRNPHASYEQ